MSLFLATVAVLLDLNVVHLLSLLHFCGTFVLKYHRRNACDVLGLLKIVILLRRGT